MKNSLAFAALILFGLLPVSADSIDAIKPDMPALIYARHVDENCTCVRWEPNPDVDGYFVYKRNGQIWEQLGETTDCWWYDYQADQNSSTYTVISYNLVDQVQIKGDFDPDGIVSDKAKDMSNDESKVDYWLGDSRIVYLAAALDIFPKCIAQAGEMYYWFSTYAEVVARSLLSAQEDLTMVFNFGVNDVTNPSVVTQYIEKYEQLIKDFPKAHIWIMSVNPADEKYNWGVDYPTMRDHIIEFNRIMKEALPDHYIDTYSYLMKKGFETDDGLHYVPDTSKTIYWLTLRQV